MTSRSSFLGFCLSFVAALGASSVTPVANAQSSSTSDGRWAQFRQARTFHLIALGDVLIDCAADEQCRARGRSVELAYGLVALHRLTGQRRFVRAAHKVVAEFEAGLETLDPQTAAWILALDLEWERSLYHDRFRAQARTAAAYLKAWLSFQDDYQWTMGVMFGNEHNVTWPMLSLARWAEHTGDGTSLHDLRVMAEQRLLADELDAWCPMPIDRTPNPEEMFPPCLARAVSIAELLPERASAWMDEFVQVRTELLPLEDPSLDTHAALNFSRGWSLWALFQITHDVRDRDAYVEHIQVQMRDVQEARERGERVDLRLAVYGVHALAMSGS